jgi:inhibitor of KinA sporulation pathway (predicted exonuclease)
MLTKVQNLSDFLFMVTSIGGALDKSLDIAVDSNTQFYLRRRLNPQLTAACQSYTMIEDFMDKETEC